MFFFLKNAIKFIFAMNFKEFFPFLNFSEPRKYSTEYSIVSGDLEEPLKYIKRGFLENTKAFWLKILQSFL